MKEYCYHCGSLCEKDKIQHNKKSFCCHGCKTVFEILHENGLTDYYQLESNPGSQQNAQNVDSKYAYLDVISIQEKLLDFFDEKINKVTFKLPTIHCSSCVWLLENLYKLDVGVLRSDVNFGKKIVHLDFDPQKTSLRKIVELLGAIGYEPNISLEDYQSKDEQKEKQNLIIKIGVAGFCFGNIMFLSFPEYFGLDELSNTTLRKFISYLTVLLSLPIVFYSAADYFVSALKSFKQRFINIDVPVAIGIATLFFRSSYEVISNTGSGYFDSLGGLVFFLLVGKWFQNKTYQSLSFDRDYKSFFPIAITKITGDKKEYIPINELKSGDTILVRNKELIPTDSILLSDATTIDYSFVTGESLLVEKSKNELIYAGGRLAGKNIELLVSKEISQSYLTQLWNKNNYEKSSITSKQQLIDNISQYFTITVILIATMTGVYWWTHNPSLIFNTVTAVLIVACPCALALTTPFTLNAVMSILGKNGFYMKNTAIVEFIGEISTVVFDKTGTITHAQQSNIEFLGGQLSEAEKLLVSTIASQSTHPMSISVKDFLEVNTTVTNNSTIQGFKEVEGAGISATINDAKIVIGNHKFVSAATKASKKQEPQDVNTSKVHVAINDVYKGLFTIKAKYRDGLSSLIKRLSEKYKLALISGDNESEKSNMTVLFPQNSVLLFSQEPNDKLKFIQSLQHKKEHVMMIGDGLNDAGALKISDVGIAVVEDISAFSPGSDVILDAKNLNKLPDFIQLATDAKKVIIAGFAISFLYNIIGILFAISGNLSPLTAAILMPLSSITVVAFSTFSVKLLAKLIRLT